MPLSFSVSFIWLHQTSLGLKYEYFQTHLMPSSGYGHPCYPYVATIQCMCDSVGNVHHCVSRLVVGGGGVLIVRQGEEEEREGQKEEGVDWVERKPHHSLNWNTLCYDDSFWVSCVTFEIW